MRRLSSTNISVSVFLFLFISTKYVWFVETVFTKKLRFGSKPQSQSEEPPIDQRSCLPQMNLFLTGSTIFSKMTCWSCHVRNSCVAINNHYFLSRSICTAVDFAFYHPVLLIMFSEHDCIVITHCVSWTLKEPIECLHSPELWSCFRFLNSRGVEVLK